MKKNNWIDLALLKALSVNSEKTATAGHERFSEKKLNTAKLFNTGIFSLMIMLAATETSYAEKNKPSIPEASPAKLSQVKDRRMLRRLGVGIYQSHAEVKKIAVKLRQLGFETWIKPQDEGYVVNAGAFSSKSNLEHAVRKLQKAGLADKVRISEVEVDKKISKAITSAKPRKVRSPVFNTKAAAVRDKSADDEYVPKKEYTKLKREVELLKAQMQSLLKQSAQAEQGSKPEQQTTSQAATNQPVEENSQTQENKLSVAEGSREQEAEESRRELDTFLRSQKVLYKRGELALDYNLSYGQNTAVNTFGFAPATNRFNTTAKLTTRSVDTSLTMRYGIIDNLEFDLTVPYGYFEQNSDNQPFNINTRPVSHTNASGIGDISGAIRYTAVTESGNIPDITLSLSGQAPTGNRHKGLGTGFWNVGAGVSLVKTIDPVVFFGSLGYNAALEDHGVNPGNSVSYSIGAGYSMNDRVSFTTSLSGGITGRTELNGLENPGSATDIHSLQFSSTIQLSKRLFLEPFIGFGLTEDASDFVVGFRVPYRFEQKFPLPFLSD